MVAMITTVAIRKVAITATRTTTEVVMVRRNACVIDLYLIIVPAIGIIAIDIISHDNKRKQQRYY